MPLINYRVVRKKGLTTSATISVSGEKGVVVRAPFWMTNGMIAGFVEEKSVWIEKHLAKINTKRVIKRYEDGEKHLFFGKEYFLSVVKTEKPVRSNVYLSEDTIHVEISRQMHEEKYPEKVKEALMYWYLEKGIEEITKKVNHFTGKMGVNYKKISLKKVSSIWGSCSPTSCLCFNRKLIMAPDEIVNYVVIHETAHLIHRNHGLEFWNLVESFDPQYKNHRKWLRHNHHLLSI